MANRRMFSKTVVASSRFLRMPATSRLLYYDLGMSADDDGYCEWYPVMQMTGAKEQDFDVLRSNELIFIFDNEVLVIKDWKENNFIRSDRYTPSKYVGKYENMLGLPFGIPDDNQMDTQVRLGKDRLGEVKLTRVDGEGNEVKPKVKKIVDHKGFESFWTLYPKKKDKVSAFALWGKMSDEDRDSCISGLRSAVKSKDWLRDNGKYIPLPKTFLENRRWEDEETVLATDDKYAKYGTK